MTMRSRRGFGTLETLVALSLFSIVLVSVGGLFMLSISSGAMAEGGAVATNLARARMEILRTLPASGILEQDGATTVERVPPVRGRPYTIHTTARTVEPGFLDLTVSVTWQVVFGSACGALVRPGCRGSAATQTRTLETRVRHEDAP
jgi:type II secretory pathway pseudopilin PulG